MTAADIDHMTHWLLLPYKCIVIKINRGNDNALILYFDHSVM